MSGADEALGFRRPLGRWGPMFAAFWLFFLLDPLNDAWNQRDTWHGQVGLLSTVVFGGTYLAIWVRLRAGRAQLSMRPPLRVALAWLSALVLLGMVMVLSLGEIGTTAVVYVAVASVMLLAARAFLAVVLALAVAVALAGWLVPGWGSALGLAFSTMAASIAVFGIRSMMNRNIELIQAHETNAALAADNERNRLARDLHDILGHSLTVITVKAELANRLLDTDPERARAEVADLERLSRDALVDVRRAVAGYRELTLPGELARARTALAAAGIVADVPNSTEEVASDLRELFAWTVREGVTNVVRHSQAGSCQIVLTPRSVEVIDDGRGPSGTATGHGLLGLRERAGAAGATVVTRPLDPGFALQVLAP